MKGAKVSHSKFNMLTMASSKMFVFGPQALGFDAASLERLRAKLTSEPQLEWALDALSTLPATLSSLATAYPEMRLIDVQKRLGALVAALRTGEIQQGLFPLNNALLSPLVVRLDPGTHIDEPLN